MGKQDMKKYNMDYVRISKSPCMNEIGKKKYGFDLNCPLCQGHFELV